MTSNVELNAFAQEGADPAPDRVEICSEEDDGFAFHFTLPTDGLALRSVAIVDGVPEIRFDASHKVPTITEEDVAIALRLASEGNRPEFFFIPIPLGHPFYGRQFNQYKPQWLRETSVGNLLFDADWIMKCLSVGARSNDEKSEFWGWQKTSQLEGLAKALNFPEDNPPGSVIMSCESAKVQKDENEMVFPEEPKMKIVDDSNSLYSKYITEIYPSVAYHDEPRFLKMQELIKLILAAEWLTEKGVRVSKKWMMEHTAKPRAAAKAIEGGAESHQDKVRSPPKEMIPSQPAIVMVPSSDVSVKTLEAEQYGKGDVGYRYGWRDSGSKEMVVFDENGALCLRQQSLKMVINHHVTVEGQLKALGFVRLSLPLPLNTPTPSMTELESEVMKQLLPQDFHQEIPTTLGHMLVDVTVDDKTVSKDGVELKLEKMIQPCSPLTKPQWKETTCTKASVNDYNLLYGHMDPNHPIRPKIPGVCEEIIPNVESWNELFNETVPWPCVWQKPHDIGDRVSVTSVVSGGVTTRSFQVEEEPRGRVKVPSRETPWVDHYKKRDSQLIVRAQQQMEQECLNCSASNRKGTIRLATSEEFTEISARFTKAWKKGRCPPVDRVFVITNSTLQRKWNAYKYRLQDQRVEEHYHGTTLTCNIMATNRLCNDGNCGICGVSNTGLDPNMIQTNITFQRFGHGFYLAPNSSKCHDYTQGAYGCRAMLLCGVCPGRKYQLRTNSQQLKGPPRGFDSVYGQVGDKLNYPEIVVYNPDAVMPRYIIVYRKDGIEHPLATNPKHTYPGLLQ